MIPVVLVDQFYLVTDMSFTENSDQLKCFHYWFEQLCLYNVCLFILVMVDLFQFHIHIASHAYNSLCLAVV